MRGELLHEKMWLIDYATHLRRDEDTTACGMSVISADAEINIFDKDMLDHISCGLCKRTNVYAGYRRELQQEKRHAKRREKRAMERAKELADILEKIIFASDDLTRRDQNRLGPHIQKAREIISWVNAGSRGSK